MADAHHDPDAPALLRRFPSLADAIPWVALGTLPTAVEPLPSAGDAELWVKRDDRTGEPYGGNKVRKLEFLLAAAERAGAERVITAGALGSHHALATAVYARERGLACTLILFPQPVTDHVREVLRLACACGAELRYTRRMEFVPLALWRARLAYRRERARIIPPGGSDPAGTLGYVSGALELAEQIDAGRAPVPDAVHVAAGTLGTAVGLAIGFEYAGIRTRIVGTRITSRIVTNRRAIRSLARGTLRRLENAGAPTPPLARVLERIELSHEQIGEGYGRATDAGRAAARRLADAGLAVERTYTAKAAADAFAAAGAEPGAVRLYWHTFSSRTPPVDPVTVDDVPARFRRFLRSSGRPHAPGD